MTVRVGSIAGVPIRIHLLVPVLAVVYVVTTRDYARREVFLSLVWFLGVMLASTLLHELGHAAACRRNRVRAHAIDLWPLGGLTHHDIERSPGARVQIALAGIAVNVLLALLAGAAHYALRGALPGVPRLVASPDLLVNIWNLNLALALLNLLPGLPFDGGGALEGLLWRRLGRPKARLVVIVTGALVCGGLVLGGLANDEVFLSVVGGWGLIQCAGLYRELRQGGLDGDDRFLGVYDFSQGRTSLDASGPEPDAADRRREKAQEKARRDAEKRETVRRAERETAEVRLDRLLERIQAEGISSLSEEERAFLNEESRRLRAMNRGKSPTRP
jgi:Zn-dependent protease